MTDFLKQLETEPDKIHGVPFDVVDRLFLGPVTGDKYEGRKMVMEAWDLTHWEIFKLGRGSGKTRFVPQPREVPGGMLLLIKGAAGIMGGSLILTNRHGPTTPDYEIHPNDPDQFSSLYLIGGQDTSLLTSTMLYRDTDEGKRNRHQPMGVFQMRQRFAGSTEILVGTFANTNSMSPHHHTITDVAFRKREETVLSNG